ncbi:MAG: hypothetical protein HOL66_01275 [Rhodospirillaceae bacterium]|nr:hypothetical protein [Rhodospirillaceae bacterium]
MSDPIKYPELDVALELLAREKKYISKIKGKKVRAKDPSDIKALVMDIAPGITEIKKGRPVAKVLADRGVSFDPTVASFGFGCTDNCSCSKNKMLADIDFLSEQITAFKKSGN